MVFPFFSVCIPSYNLAHYLPEAIESVMQQTFKDFELLIADDGSNDNTDQVMKELISKYNDSRIIYWRNPKNSGSYGNANILCRKAKGRFILIFCADDRLSPVCLEAIYIALKQSDFLYNMVTIKFTNHLEKLVNVIPGQLPLSAINKDSVFKFIANLGAWRINLDNYCVKNDFFKQMNYFGETHINSYSKDFTTWINLALVTNVLLLDVPLLYVRQHLDQHRNRVYQINSLTEMFHFFCDDEQIAMLGKFKDFEYGREKWLDRSLAIHYLFSFKLILMKWDFAYFYNIRNLQKKFNYTEFPFFAVFKKFLHSLTRAIVKSKDLPYTIFLIYLLLSLNLLN